MSSNRAYLFITHHENNSSPGTPDPTRTKMASFFFKKKDAESAILKFYYCKNTETFIPDPSTKKLIEQLKNASQGDDQEQGTEEKIEEESLSLTTADDLFSYIEPAIRGKQVGLLCDANLGSSGPTFTPLVDELEARAREGAAAFFSGDARDFDDPSRPVSEKVGSAAKDLIATLQSKTASEDERADNNSSDVKISVAAPQSQPNRTVVESQAKQETGERQIVVSTENPTQNPPTPNTTTVQSESQAAPGSQMSGSEENALNLNQNLRGEKQGETLPPLSTAREQKSQTASSHKSRAQDSLPPLEISQVTLGEEMRTTPNSSGEPSRQLRDPVPPAGANNTQAAPLNPSRILTTNNSQREEEDIGELPTVRRHFKHGPKQYNPGLFQRAEAQPHTQEPANQQSRAPQITDSEDPSSDPLPPVRKR